MCNKSKELRKLFREHMENKRKVVSTPPVYGVHSVPSFNGITIYFYEWSDISNTPRYFNSVSEFESFTRMSGIPFEYFHKDIINNLKCAYISCYQGSTELNIRGTYKLLLDSMREHNAKKLLPSICT